MTKIPATIGILTYNCAEHLERCLKSVRDFNDIVAADGGSTDGTLALLERYGASVIPQSSHGTPITDFSLERNRLLAAAQEPWFFYLDSDEIMSMELAEHIRNVSTDSSHPYQAYRVRYLKTSADGTRPYRTYREYYQTRLVRTDIGAVFVRSVHERLSLPHGTNVGQTESPWYVPLEPEDLSAASFGRKAWKRTGRQACAWTPGGVGDIAHKVFLEPLMLIIKSLIKIPLVKLRWGGEAIPLKYELLRILYSLMLSIQHTRRLFHRP